MARCDRGHKISPGGACEVCRYVESTASPVANQPAAEPAAERPRISVSGRHLHQIADDAWDVLLAENDPPTYFQHGGSIAEVEDDEEGPRIVHLSHARLRGRLDRIAAWERETKEGIQPARPPRDVVEDMQALPRLLPPLRGITGTPAFARDGTLATDPGYQPATQLYYAPAGQPVPPVPAKPDDTDIMRAKQIIGQEWLSDFPFLDDASRAHAIAVPVTAIARELIDGPVPLFAIDAPTAGTGKSLLAGGVGLVVSGSSSAVMADERNEEELRKRVTAILIAGRPVAVFDNVRRRLQSSVLGALLTATTWSDRILGKSDTLELPNRTVWMATGNNLQMNDEMARRTVWIRIDAKIDRPWQRVGFRHPDLTAWLSRHRHELVWAFLVLVRNWLARGRPEWEGRPLGSYESWSSVVGGIFGAAGIEGLLANREELYRRMDAETEEWRTFTRAWWEEHHDEPVKAASLLGHSQELLPSLFESAKESSSERALKTRLGKALAEQRDRRFGDLFIRQAGTDGHMKGALWRLELVRGADVDGANGSTSAQHPQGERLNSDTDAEDAEHADMDSGSYRNQVFLEGGEGGNASMANRHPQDTHLPRTDTNLAPEGADVVRMMGAQLPQEHPHSEGGCGLAADEVFDIPEYKRWEIGEPCYACRRTAWRQRPDGGWVCGVCHPEPRKPAGVRVLFGGDGRRPT
jgi:putative DNA primase/helicase